MQIYGIYFIAVEVLLFYSVPAFAKNLFQGNTNARNDDDWDQAAESFSRISATKREQPFDDNRKVNKALEYENMEDDAVETFNEKKNQKRSPFGIVYSGGQPIGIIEPLYQSYQFKNIDNPIHNYKKRDSIDQLQHNAVAEIDNQQNNANLHGGKYAAVLANFKIDNRLKTDLYKNDDTISVEKRREKNRISKRDPFDEGSPAKDLSKPSNFIGTSTSKNKRETLNLEKIEHNILDVMDDLGLAEGESKFVQKRNVNISLNINRDKRDYDEDEDLESGINKISMVKENLERTKKNNVFPKVETTSKDLDGQINTVLKRKRKYAPKIANYQSEGEEYIRNKRHNSDEDTVVKDLETSGELTVSGNKSPLVFVNSEQNNSDNKRDINASAAMNATAIKKRNNELGDYERLLEKNIQDKISAIKMDVKREIYNLNKREMKETNAEPAEKLEHAESDNCLLQNSGAREERKSIISNFNDKDVNDGPNQQIRLRREADDCLTSDEDLDLAEDNDITNNIPGKRKANSDDTDDTFIKDKRTVDVRINNDAVNFSNDLEQTINTRGFNNKFAKRNNDVNLANSMLPIIQTSQPGNFPYTGNVQQTVQPPPLQPPNQPQQPPANQLQQSLDQPSINGLSTNTLQHVAAQDTVVPPSNGISSVVNSTNPLPLIKLVNQSYQGSASVMQKPQHPVPVLDANVAPALMSANNGVNASMKRQNLVNEYDDDDFDMDKSQEVRSTDLELNDDGTVRIEKEISDNNDLDEDDDSYNERKLIRQERSLQNVTSEEELFNQGNNILTFDQRKRRQADNYPLDDYNDVRDTVMTPSRAKRTHYDTFGAQEEMYNGDDADDFQESEDGGTYRKRNVNSDIDYEIDRNNYYNKIERQRRNNNYPNYKQHSNMRGYDIIPDNYLAEDYRRRKRHAFKSASASSDDESLPNYHEKDQTNNRSYRKKRLGKMNRKSTKDVNIEAFSNNELFGGLPQSFQGELSRFKRVKRADDY